MSPTTEHVQLERRTALRLPWVTRVEVNRQGASPVAADSVNLSEAGMCVRLREAMEISSALTLRLFAEARRPGGLGRAAAGSAKPPAVRI